jgi:hypothetical protein
MIRAMLVTAMLLAVPGVRIPRLRPFWKESGWISTCAGVGCMGRKTECFTYSIHNSDGGSEPYYCYGDLGY